MTAPARESTAVARTDEKKSGIVALFEAPSARAMIEPFLPEGTDIRRVAATVRLATQDNPALLKCSPQSLVLATAKIQQWGLEVGTTAYLVPYGEKCTPVASYIGLAELVIASGAVRDVQAHVVYEHEHFRMEQGLSPVLEHRLIATASERGKPIGAYVVFRVGVNRDRFHYMTVDEIEAIRQKYSKQWKAGALPEWYMLKTVVRHGVKMLPKNPKLARVFARFSEIERAEEADELLPLATTVRTLPGTPLPALGTPGASGQAMAGYPGAADAPERITTRAVEDDPYAGDLELAIEDEAER